MVAQSLPICPDGAMKTQLAVIYLVHRDVAFSTCLSLTPVMPKQMRLETFNATTPSGTSQLKRRINSW